MENTRKKYYLLVAGICFALVVMAGTYIVVSKRTESLRTKIQVEPTAAPTQTPKVYGASVVLKSSSGLLKQSISNDLILLVSADSEGTDVVGYDLTLRYPNTSLQLKSAQSLLSDFNLFTYKKDNIISLTGSKSLASKNPILFSGTDIVKLTFQPLEKGTVTIELVDEYRKTKSQIVDPKSKAKFITPTNIILELY